MHQTRETLMNSHARLVPRTILKSRWSSRQGQLRREERRWIAGNGNLVEPLNTRHGGGTSIGLDLASLDLEWFNLRLPLLQKRGMHCTCRDMVKFRQSAENAWSGSKQATVFGILDRWLAPSFWLKFGNRQYYRCLRQWCYYIALYRCLRQWCREERFYPTFSPVLTIMQESKDSVT